MTREEVKRYVEHIADLYGSSFKPFARDPKSTIDAWYRKLEKVSVADAEKALDKFFEKEDYPPTLAQIMKLLPVKGRGSSEWMYEKDQYGFEYVVKAIDEEHVMRRHIHRADPDTYEDDEGYLWAIREE